MMTMAGCTTAVQSGPEGVDGWGIVQQRIKVQGSEVGVLDKCRHVDSSLLCAFFPNKLIFPKDRRWL